MTNPVIRPIPLSQLELSPENVRKTPASGNALAELTASIAAHGLIGSLLVQSPHPGPDGAGRYPVIAGGRRLAALNALARDAKLEPDYLVPCRVVDNAAIAQELSLAENVVRSDMHPADQVEAFHDLARKGATAETIAERFGVSTRLVSQRLRLGGVDPALLTAYREERLSLDTLTAFAMTTDQAHQRAVWDQVKDQHHIPSSWQVKRLMTEDRVPASARNARFVGIDVYEAAGGIVTRDLFADDHEQGTWLDDPTLLNTLATAKLEAAADAIRPDWKWVNTALDIDWQSLADYGRIDAIPGELTTEQQAEFERLTTRHDELTDDTNEDNWTDALEDEYQTVTDRIAELEAIPDERATFPDELQPHAGVILTIHHDATLRTIKGLIRPDDKQAIEAAATSDDDAPAGFHLPPGASRQPIANPEAEARKAAGLGNALGDDLRAIRTTIIKTHLAADFEAAFDLLLFQLARGVFTYGYHARALDITIAETADRPSIRAGDEDFAAHNPGEAALNDHAALPLDWLKIKDDAESFAALTALAPPAKQQLFAACIARGCNGQLAFEHGARPELEATAARLDIDFAAWTRPIAALFWSRITKAHILAIAREHLGDTWAHQHAALKKGDLAEAMENAFAATPEGIPAEATDAARVWVHPGFRPHDHYTIPTATDDPIDAAATAEDNTASNVDPAPIDHTEDPPTDNAIENTANDVSNDNGATTKTPTPLEILNSVPMADGSDRVVIINIPEAPIDKTATPARDNGNGQDKSNTPLTLPDFLHR